jgi:hypothetical protein
MQGANSGKSALRAKIRGELARHALGEEFECELIDCREALLLLKARVATPALQKEFSLRWRLRL